MGKKTRNTTAKPKRRREIPDPRTVVKEIEGFLPDGTRVTVVRTTQRDEYEETPPKKRNEDGSS